MSLDSLMDTSKEIFKLDKEIVDFNIDLSKFEESSSPVALSETQISITNLTDNYLAFRTKTTKKTLYAVNPNSCIISPNEVKTLNIILYSVPGEKIETKKHRFLFEGFVINENEKDKAVKDLFVEYQNRGNKIIGNIQKRSVKYNDVTKSIENEKENNDKTVDIKVEQLKKEETKSKEDKTISEKNDVDKDKDNGNEKDDKEKINDKNNEIKKNNNSMVLYLIIGALVISLFAGFYLFKK